MFGLEALTLKALATKPYEAITPGSAHLYRVCIFFYFPYLKFVLAKSLTYVA